MERSALNPTRAQPFAAGQSRSSLPVQSARAPTDTTRTRSDIRPGSGESERASYEQIQPAAAAGHGDGGGGLDGHNSSSGDQQTRAGERQVDELQ